MHFSLITETPPTPRTDRHRLAGTVTVDGQPARRLVVVIDRVSLILKAAVQSDPVTGAWELTGLAEYPVQQLLVVSLDDTGTYNAEVADYISQIATYTPPAEE